MMVKSVFAICVLLFLTPTAKAGSSADAYGSVEFRAITSKQGLSQMTVLDIIQDAQGYMWFATREGVNRFDGYRIKGFKSMPSEPNSISSNYASCFELDRNKQLWVGTQYGINRYDPHRELFEQFYFYEGEQRSNQKNRVRKLLSDSQGVLWLATRGGLAYFDYSQNRLVDVPQVSFPIFNLCEVDGALLIAREPHGLYRFDPQTRQLAEVPIGAELLKTNIRTLHYSKSKELFLGTSDLGLWCLDGQTFEIRKNYRNRLFDPSSLSNNSVRSIVEDRDSNLVVATFDGVSILPPDGSGFLSIKNREGERSVFTHFSLHSLYFDREGTLWLGTWAGGVNYGNPQWSEKTFRVLNPYPHKKQQGIVGALCSDRDGVWIGIEGSGLAYYEFKTKRFKHYPLPDIDRNKLRNNIVSAIAKDGRRLFVGTNIGLICCMDIPSGRIVRTYRVPEDKSVVSLCSAGDGAVLVGINEERGLLLFTPDGGVQREFRDDAGKLLEFEFLRSILPIGESEFIILSNKYGYYRYNIQNQECQFFDLSKHTQSRNDGINCVYRDRHSQLWLGTSENGLYCMDMSGNLVARYLYPEQLLGNTVYGIAEDRSGNIWFSQLDNLAKLEVSSKKVRNFSSVDVNEFSLRSALFANGKMYFGGDKGLVEFDPNRISEDHPLEALVISRLLLNNQPAKASGLGFRSGEFRLNYKQNNLTIEYAALEYFMPKDISYAYKLEGFDSDWNSVGNRQVAYYTNIPSGNYTFRLKASNGNGQWVEMDNPMCFVVTPPFWLSGWAYVFYLFGAMMVAYFAVHYAKKQIRLRNDLIVQKTHQKNLERLHEDRINLFTNLSHELRTPLSLIVSPLNEIMDDESLPSHLVDSLSLIQRNSKRLLFIANELLDFRKKESGTIVLRVAPGDFSLFIYEIVLSFSQVAIQRDIRIEYEGKGDGIHLWYDRSWMEKVLFNLLSNAMKNTPNGGSIVLDSSVEGAHYKLMLQDSGRGIPEDQLDAIFEPFYQIREDHASIRPGTGIGLSLVKGVVELHHGTIAASNNREGGACFTILLPLGKSHFSDSQIIDNYKSSEEIANYPDFEVELSDDPDQPSVVSGKKELLLIVEDNKDVREYLKRMLERKYQIVLASNGADGLVLAMNHLPDLIISDVMMPKMDGVELCRRLKEMGKTSHIPIILLTARASMTHVDEGLNIGADDYITKPFDPKLLFRRIENLLANRKRLKQIYGHTFGDELIRTTASNVEEEFLNRLYKVIEAEISNPSFSAELLGKQMGMSKTSLYTRCKELCGCAPSDLIRKMRMELAQRLFDEGIKNVMEVAMKCGYNSPSYFTSSFKSCYGQTPSEYIRSVGSA